MKTADGYLKFEVFFDGKFITDALELEDINGWRSIMYENKLIGLLSDGKTGFRKHKQAVWERQRIPHKRHGNRAVYGNRAGILSIGH